ncbi:exosortase family protein XrtF [Flavobacterium cellulosilyticum]|uniref:Exosortase family protein XrtF n=1 Tax=Flavobacterium cellulosilyticum TaxID=2541731 RepID=A0A4R5C9Q3_9FLAO|nr:exosortase family protein XrtF [Flavobacterium cellulosilyticum]TDD93742.1 exosortase family protein XrtF [Flavobacterium cellulosilyticum]
MKKYFILYKPFLIFLGKFLLTYLVLTFVYQLYLDQFDGEIKEVDGVTKMVAEHSKDLSFFFNYDAKILPNLNEPAIDFYYNNKKMARIIEGCNGLSVIILFISFIVAFSGKKRTTILFLIGGSLLIYILNVVRIALLCILMYYHPEQEHFLHGVLFPVFIYGVVFILWIIWVNKFSKYATKNIES